MPAKKVFCSQLLSQSSVDYPPPISSLPSLPATSQGFVISMCLYFSWAPYCICLALRQGPHHCFPHFHCVFRYFHCTHDLFPWNGAILTHSVQFSSLQAQLNWNGFQVRLCSRCLLDIAWHSGKKIMRSHYELSPVLIRALSPDTSASLLQDKNSLLSSVLVWLQVVQWFPASLDLHQQSLWRHEKS